MKIFNSRFFIFLILISPSLLFSACHEKPQVLTVTTNSRAWLGVQIGDLSKKMLKNLDLDAGIKILKVFKNSPAEEAGLEEDDILISFDGKSIKSTAEFIDMVRDRQIGDEIKITYLRNREKYTTEVKIGESSKHASGYIIKRKTPKDHFIYQRDHTWLGVNTENLTDQLREYFAVPDDEGILLTNVFAESPAQKAGLLAGDVIIKVADRKIENTYDLIRAINYFDPDDVVEIIVIREKKELTVEVKLGKKNKSSNFFRYGIAPEEIEIEIPEIDMEIPEIEVEIDADELQLLHEGFEEELKIKSQELENKLESLNDKLKEMRIKIKSWNRAVI